MGRYPFWSHIYRYRHRYAIGLGALVVVDLINISMPLAVRYAIDSIPLENRSGLLYAAVALCLMFLVQSVCRYVWRIYLIGTAHRIAKNLRVQLYKHLQGLPLSYYQKVRTGDLMSRATNDIEAVRLAMGPGILVTVDAVLMFILIIPVMFWLSWKLSLFAFALFPLIPFITSKIGDRIDSLFESLQTKLSKLSAYTQESFGAVRLIKSLVLETQVQSYFQKHSKSYQVEGIELAKAHAVFSPALSLISQTGVFLILLIGGLDVIQSALTVGTFVAFQRFVAQLAWPMEAIGWAVTLNREGIAAYRRLREILDAPQVQSTRTPSHTVAPNPPLLHVRQLTFEYQENLNNFSLEMSHLEIEPGQKIGIVGPVGCGKTTFFDLLLRLHEPSINSIFWKGRDVASIDLSLLRNEISSVEQQIHLFSESVVNNLKIGTPVVEVESFLQQAGVLSEIEELPLGNKTLLGEKGVNLSGGQKQRLALARSLVRNPDLLLLDDAFSAVDVKVEKQIINNLFEAYPHLSFCVASHRLSIMPKLDIIWVMDKGQVIAKGSHDSLLKTSPLYQSLWQEHFGRESLRPWEPPKGQQL